MYRTSSKKEFYKSGTVIIDADGIPFEPASKDYVNQRVEDRSPRVLLHYGAGDPVLSSFSDARVGDIVERVSDGSRWKVEA